MDDPAQKAVGWFWDDNRALIAAGKVQRWDVVKSTVTLNLALATAAIALERHEIAIALCSIIVAGAGFFLVLHYNSRLTAVRKTQRQVLKYMNKHMIDRNALLDVESVPMKRWTYDQQELWAFMILISLSVVPALLVAMTK